MLKSLFEHSYFKRKKFFENLFFSKFQRAAIPYWDVRAGIIVGQF